MTDLERSGIDDPGGPGGQDVGGRTTPPGDTADNTGGPGEPQASELDLPGPNDPVAWSYVEPGTAVVGPGGEELGVVAQMLGTETEGIFHGLAVKPANGGPPRIVLADSVTHLTPSKVEISHGADALAAAEEHRPPQR